jgi:hypothetical protein
MRGSLCFLLFIVALLHCTIAVLGYKEHRLNENYKQWLPPSKFERDRPNGQ